MKNDKMLHLNKNDVVKFNPKLLVDGVTILYLTELIAEMRRHEKEKFTEDYYLRVGYDNWTIEIYYNCGYYRFGKAGYKVAIQSEDTFEPTIARLTELEIASYTSISRQAFDDAFNGQRTKYPSHVIDEYKRFKLGARVYNGFWSNMSQSEFNYLLRYIAIYDLDLDTRERAMRLNTNDFKNKVKIAPKTLTERSFNLYDLAVSVYPDIKPWEMVSMPRGYMCDDMRMEMIEAVLTSHNITIVDVNKKHIKAVAPALLNSLKSAKGVIAFYLASKEIGGEVNE